MRIRELLKTGRPEDIRMVLEFVGTGSTLPKEAEPLRLHDQVQLLTVVLARPERAEFLTELKMALGRVGVKNAHTVAEEWLAELLNRRDRWDLWVRALRLLGFRKMATSIAMDVAEFDVALFKDPTVLGSIAWMKDGVLAAKAASTLSVWQNVPDFKEGSEPSPDAEMLDGYAAAAMGMPAIR